MAYLGYYSENFGTDSRDSNYSIGPGQAYFAKGGNDSLWVSGTSTVRYQGTDWWVGSLVNGSTGDDAYYVNYGSATIIADASRSAGDSLRIFDYLSNVNNLFSIDNRHVFIGTSWGTKIVIIDGLNSNGAIEKIQFSDITLSGVPASAKAIVAQYQTMENQTLSQLEEKKLFKPEVMGINSSDVSGILDGLYAYSYSTDSNSAELVDTFLTRNGSTQSISLLIGNYVDVKASSWSDRINLIQVAQASNLGSVINADQINFSSTERQGCALIGGSLGDQLWGKAGWDILDGGAGNDLIRAGNGRDIITGGLGADELHGDFGWNTYTSEKDGFSDLIAIKSDEFLTNWIYGKAGNNPNGEKADIIEGLDASDRIKIIGVDSKDISIRAGATAHGISGIGIYAGGALEALYTGGDLSVAQLTVMTSGDGSAAAMANQVSSYGWTGV